MTPELALDHLVVTCADLSEGAAYVTETLAVSLSEIGHHDRMGTHNRLLSLGPDVYLEVIAVDPAAPSPAFPRWYNLDAFSGAPRLTHWACRTNNLDWLLDGAPDSSGAPMSFARSIFSWRMAVPETGQLPFDGAMPALIEWETGDHPAPLLPEANVRLSRLQIAHPRATRLAEEFLQLAHLPGVSLVSGPEFKMTAEIQTPNGAKVLQ